MSRKSDQSSPSDDQLDSAISIIDDVRKNPIQLDGRVRWRLVLIEALRYWYIPACLVGYGVHHVFRRHVPRRMAPWTPLRLSELYATWGLGISLVSEAFPTLNRLHKDDDLAVVAVAGPLVQSDPVRRGSVFCNEAVQDPRAKEIARAIRECSYDRSLRGKLLQWHYHLWSDRASWDEVATTIAYRSLQNDPSWTPRNFTDFDICTSYIALYMRNGKRSTYIDCSLYAALGASIPIAIFLRRSGRRSLYLPMNIIQRVLIGLIGLIFYSHAGFAYYSWNNLWNIRDKEQVAAAVRRVFGDTRIDEEIAEMRQALKVFDVFGR
ncbi:hypothetical protein L226DRAFT_574314 [Lentinus tigrinus ALCF2SS1-7]|uniref:Uncharacterized protein n=1 Tax=Lentinus tigrinus ALCF2SS1-6 TaxID=1328759 RepID=A0A5C2RZ27_9APHY|nr:hypothetical protein L227DRAFT_614701 [Lentinus tigrinus ALCF2SS1-6]RPD71098.1 hypothetical protein L226DRAFT_574314 [Lentinus tigrinus ALCF2SS1-7]